MRKQTPKATKITKAIKKAAPKKKVYTINLNIVFTVIVLFLSLFLFISVVQTPQNSRQLAQNVPEVPPPPQCGAAADGSGLCRPVGQCLPGEENDVGVLDCSAGQTCCGLAPVPPQCLAAGNGQTTFCGLAANCMNVGGMDVGQLDCPAGVICCNNPNFTPGAPPPASQVPSQPVNAIPTLRPTITLRPTLTLRPSLSMGPTPTFGVIKGPDGMITGAPSVAPTTIINNPTDDPPLNEGEGEGVVGIIIAILRLFLEFISDLLT